MGRKKVRLELITNDSVRKTTFRKRKGGLLKKASELKTLCGVDACALIYTANDAEPHVWPSPAEAHQVLERFQSLPTKKQGKHMLNHEDYRPKDVSMLELKLENGMNRNRDLEIELLLMDHLSGKNVVDLMEMDEMKILYEAVDDKIKDLTLRMDNLKGFKVEEDAHSVVPAN
ncbi:agamous-like MADS-box protein AGL80 [Rhodamnia argentea]|uniref:Agamous-like MADS-box protein AGL80 n=1 Tax=Rhodamnia argentea TaxID=178133 RepID=A0A8B8PGT4_9MYRT|nr:agamous-like MADS-box protein AGL80 [Rhodamnia argentea]